MGHVTSRSEIKFALVDHEEVVRDLVRGRDPLPYNLVVDY